MSRFAIFLTALAAAGLLAPLAAEAQKIEALTYRCVGKDKKTYYGQTLPAQCIGLPLEMLNQQGVVVRRIDPQGDVEKKALKEAQDKKKREEDALVKERLRRDKALLASYASEADVDAARKRALLDNEKATQEIDTRIAGIQKRQAGLAKEMEFYRGKNKPPAKLDQDVKSADAELKLQAELRDKKKKEVDSINAKYDEDKRRYAELTRGSAAK
ncbi:MAG: hypothetical protein EPN19_08095 [Betaproteobacteria bacterium]|nr:MAG: hypothetical protein EPN19_08095 [Betaproteobacteria bacterium]